MKTSLLLPLFTLMSLLLFGQEKKSWTIMHYAAGSNSSEIDLMEDVQEMIHGKQSDEYELILLIDRTDGHTNDSTTLGENFDDTRLYRIRNNAYEELNGKEFLPEILPDATFDINMADANTLKRFVQYCKKYYPAEHYMLIMRSHGNGLSMCPDHENGTRDQIYPAEMSDILTKRESVDILGLDVCSMAGLENLYEWRPDGNTFGASYVIASAPVSAAWAYDKILERLRSDKESTTDENYFSKGSEEYHDPKKMTPLAFAKLIMEEVYDSQPWASWGLFDNRKIEDVKTSIDILAQKLVNENQNVLINTINNSLGYHHITGDDSETAQLTQPYLDSYDFFHKIALNDTITAPCRNKAKKVCENLDQLVIQSYYGSGFLPIPNDFKENKYGSYIILPKGNRIYSKTGSTFWAHTNWYHPDNQEAIGNAYGKYDWCADGAISRNQKVENFFELLDYLFDDKNDESGGVNKYQW